MKRLFAQLGHAVVLDVDEPELRPGEVLVDTAFSTVSSGTEQLILLKSGQSPGVDEEYPGSDPHWPKIRDGVAGALRPRPPYASQISLGYSAAGIVRAVGAGITDIAVGSSVACSGSQCAHHAEVLAVPRNLLVPVPADVALSDAAFVTLGSIAMEALRKADLHFGETVVIYGLGLLGLLAAQLAHAAGIYVVGFDIDPAALARARNLGITDVHDPSSPSATEAVRAATGGFGADAVLIGVVTESNAPLNHALELCRQRGTVVGIGVFGMTLDRTRIATNDVVIKQTIAYGPGRYDPRYEEDGVDYPIGLVRWTENRNMGLFLRLLAEGRVDVRPLAPEPIPIVEAPAAYGRLTQTDRPPTVQFRYPAAP